MTGAPTAVGPSRRTGRYGAIRTLSPGYFALVMATGIVSAAADHLDLPRISGVLLGVTIAACLLLGVGYCWRAVAYRADFLSDLRAPATGFAFFTVVAGCNVLAGRLLLDGHRVGALVLVAVGTVTWLALSYAVPLHVITASRTDGVLGEVNGTWLVWVVATQSLSVAASDLVPLWPAQAENVSLLAVAFWGVGVVLYLMIMTILLARLLIFPVGEDDLTPPYWISMGATAITVLAGARLLQLPAVSVTTAVLPVVTGLCIVLWAFGTWLWPPLLVRTMRRRTRRSGGGLYRPTIWSMIFPFGMYSVSSVELGAVTRTPWIRDIGLAEGWLALVAWGTAFAAMLVSLLASSRARAHS